MLVTATAYMQDNRKTQNKRSKIVLKRNGYETKNEFYTQTKKTFMIADKFRERKPLRQQKS